MTSFFMPTYENPFMGKSENGMVEYLNAMAQNPTKEIRPFIYALTEFGNKLEHAYFARVKKINLDGTLKLNLPIPEHRHANFNQKSRVWKITKILNLKQYINESDCLKICVTN